MRVKYYLDDRKSFIYKSPLYYYCTFNFTRLCSNCLRVSFFILIWHVLCQDFSHKKIF